MFWCLIIRHKHLLLVCAMLLQWQSQEPLRFMGLFYLPINCFSAVCLFLRRGCHSSVLSVSPGTSQSPPTIFLIPICWGIREQISNLSLEWASKAYSRIKNISLTYKLLCLFLVVFNKNFCEDLDFFGCRYMRFWSKLRSSLGKDHTLLNYSSWWANNKGYWASSVISAK